MDRDNSMVIAWGQEMGAGGRGYGGINGNGKINTPIQKNLCIPMFIAAQFTIVKYWKQPKCPSANEWIKKLWYIYTTE